MSQQVRVYRELTVGSSGSPVNLATSGQKAAAVYAKSTRTSGDQIAGYFEYHLAGNRCEGQAVRAVLELDAEGGGSEEAIYAIADMNAQTYIGGKISAVRGMLVLPTETVTHGTFTALEAEVYSNTGIGGLNNVPGGFMAFTLNGTAKTHFDNFGYLFILTGVASGSTNLWYDHTEEGTASLANEWLKIWTPNGAKFLAVYDAVA